MGNRRKQLGFIIHITTGFTEVFSRLGKSEEGGNTLALF